MFAGVDLTKSYGSRDVFRDLNLHTSPGRALVIRGRNGSGKTTLLRCLLGAEPLDAGHVVLEGQRQQTSAMAYWSQAYGILDDFSWFPELTIADHLRLHDPETDSEGALAQFGIADLADRLAASLSSGQLRRAGLASSLVRPWKVLLLDEPEQRLDDRGVRQLVTALTCMLAAGRTIVLSTHLERLPSELPSDVVTMGEIG